MLPYNQMTPDQQAAWDIICSQVKKRFKSAGRYTVAMAVAAEIGQGKTGQVKKILAICPEVKDIKVIRAMVLGFVSMAERTMEVKLWRPARKEAACRV